jgi:hypothetical protein
MSRAAKLFAGAGETGIAAGATELVAVFAASTWGPGGAEVFCRITETTFPMADNAALAAC